MLYVVFVYTFVVLSTGMSACLGALLPEMFSTRARYSGVSICYQGGSVVASFSPMVASALVAEPGGVQRLSWLIAGITLFALLALWRTAERRGLHLGAH
ncbi:shikimate transporter [compost metagenome]